MMWKALLQKQLRELGAAFVRSRRTGRQRSRAGRIGYAVLFAGLAVLLMLNFSIVTVQMAALLVPQGLGALYFVMMELSALTVSVLASAFTSYAHLFRCKDNEQLLALPIPPGAIFAVRCSGVYLTGLLYLLLVWVPAVCSYVRAAPQPGGVWLGAVLTALALAGASMLLSVVLGWAVALLTSRAKHKSVVTVAGALAFAALYYAVLTRVQNALDQLVVAVVLTGEADRIAAPVQWLGRAAMGSIPAMLGLAALTVLCVASFGLAFAGPYLRLLTRNTGTPRAEYRAKPQKQHTLRQALLRRELRHLGSSPVYLLNCALVSLLLPVLAVAAVWKANALRAFTAAYPPANRAMLVCGVVCILAAVNFLAAPSVSLEGTTLWQLQSLPVTPWQVLRAKLELQVLLTLPGAALCAGCSLAALQAPPVQWLAVLATLTAFLLLTAQLDLMLGLCLPNLHWTSEALLVKQSAASMLAMFSGFMLAAGVLVLPLLALDHLPPYVVQPLCLALLAAGDVLLYRWLRTKGTQKFAELG